MICYRDMTFCPFWEDCGKANECHRPLTEEVIDDAERWWGSPEAPIARFGAKPACHTDFDKLEPDNG